MSLADRLAGAHYRYPDHYDVEREKIREYARAVKAVDPASLDLRAAADLGYDGLVASLTFISVFGHMAISGFFEHCGVTTDDAQIVQVDQKFHFHRPIRVGDALTGTMHIESVDERFGADIVTTRNVCAELDGTVVMEAFTTLMGHEGDNSISAKWDPETGQVIRTAVRDTVIENGQQPD